MVLEQNQAKFIVLMSKLDLEVKEYKILCNKLENSKNNKNDEELTKLYNCFKQNYENIIKIKKQIKELNG